MPLVRETIVDNADFHRTPGRSARTASDLEPRSGLIDDSFDERLVTKARLANENGKIRDYRVEPGKGVDLDEAGSTEVIQADVYATGIPTSKHTPR